MGTLAVTEKRGVVDKFRDFYQRKVVDTGTSASFEEMIDKQVEMEKTFVKVAGTIATIALIFYPADGPVGEILTALATPLLAKVIDLKGNLVKETVIGAKRNIEANYIGTDGRSEKVAVPDLNLIDSTHGISDLKDTATKYASSIESNGRNI